MFGSQPFGENFVEEDQWGLLSIFGAEDGDGEGEGSGDSDSDSDSDSGDGSGTVDSGSDAEGEEGQNQQDERDRRIGELSTEAKNRRLQLRAKEKELAEAQAKLEALQKKGDDGEIDEAVRQKIEGPLLEKIEKMTTASRNTAIRNAILAEGQKDGADRRVWHSADNVLSQIDMDAIDYDPESGTIEGVSDELSRIADEQPFLVKEKGKPKRQTKDADSDKGKRGASGNQPGGAGRQVHGMDKKRKEELAKKFPVLNRR